MNAFCFYSHIGLIFVEKVLYINKILVAILQQVNCVCPYEILPIFPCIVCIHRTRLSLRILPCNTVAFWHRLGDKILQVWECNAGELNSAFQAPHNISFTEVELL